LLTIECMSCFSIFRLPSHRTHCIRCRWGGRRFQCWNRAWFVTWRRGRRWCGVEGEEETLRLHKELWSDRSQGHCL